MSLVLLFNMPLAIPDPPPPPPVVAFMGHGVPSIAALVGMRTSDAPLVGVEAHAESRHVRGTSPDLLTSGTVRPHGRGKATIQ